MECICAKMLPAASLHAHKKKKNSKKRYGRIWEPGDFLCKDDAFMPPFEEMSHSSCLSPAMQAIIFGVKPDSNRMVMFV